MARVTDEQIEQARKISLLEYFQKTNPIMLRHVGGGRYVHKNHDSFVIDNGKGQFFWNSRGVGGVSSIDYLMRIEGMGFIDAVNSLTTGSLPISEATQRPPLSVPTPAPPPKSFTLPKPAESNDNMVAYLRSRGISASTTRKYINQGLLYESANNSCVFVGRDSQDGNKPKYAAERSIAGDGKKDVAGSDKAFSFCLPPDKPDTKTVAIFESGIDALSHHEIMMIAKAERGSSQMITNLLADFDGYRLSLSGTVSAALSGFLERHPDIQNIYLCLDSDPAGEKATERIIKELLSDSRYADKNIIIAPTPIGKDYNDALTGIRQILAERNTPERQTQNIKKARKSTHIRESPDLRASMPTRRHQAGVSI
ncbi:MAG: DUF3991 and toprim domain-containing protein [Treponema sp.]|jgi:hypothetical protein|nr:DUF3991 and toprim domain-containing protein [Treponema sp.]